VIIPCYWKGALVGYTARSWDPAVKKKYYSQFDKNFIFNVDSQSNDWKFVIVCEGAFDAMSVDGVSVLGNEINEEQVDIIDSLGKEVIVVPDFDVKPNGKWSGKLLIEQAKEYNWTVSFPLWHTTCKDINAAVVKYGKLFTLQSILVGRVNNNLKIELLKRKLMAVS
jgi:5S rRNA maturation endonuclease (ribonuclease M5)